MEKRNFSATHTPMVKRAWRGQFWSASTVQREIYKLLDTKEFRGSPHAAYLGVYARMTKARDAARTEPKHPMYPADALDRRLNDALSDLMTRNYLEIVRSCVATPNAAISESLDLGGNFHDLHHTAEKQNWDAVQVALGSTALYLSQHLALALSTLPHLEELWKGTPYQDISSRIQRTEKFKTAYDAFNEFLAKNLITVANALREDKLIKGNRLEIAAKIAQPLLPWAELFGAIRDKAFTSGINIARHTKPGEHPWTVVNAKGETRMANCVLQAPKFQNEHGLQRDLTALQLFSKRLAIYFSNPLIRLFEGKRYAGNEMTREIRPSNKGNEMIREIRPSNKGNLLRGGAPCFEKMDF